MKKSVEKRYINKKLLTFYKDIVWLQKKTTEADTCGVQLNNGVDKLPCYQRLLET